MSGIVILRGALEALNSVETPKSDTGEPIGADAHWRSGAVRKAPGDGETAAEATRGFDATYRSGLIARLGETDTAPAPEMPDGGTDVFFRDDLDGESVRLLALKAQQQLAIQALAIANVRALSIIGLFREEREPDIRLM